MPTGLSLPGLLLGVVGGGGSLPGATFTMSQLPAQSTNRVYQRDTVTGGGQNKGQGSLTVPVTVTTDGAVYARRRSASDGTTVVQSAWLVNANVTTATTNLLISGIDAPAMTDAFTPAQANDGWAYLDLAPSPGGPWQLGTVPFAVGGLTAFAGQSLAAGFVDRNTADATTIAGSGLTISTYARIFAGYNYARTFATTAGAVPSMTWQAAADGGTYNSTFAVEFLNRRIAQTGIIRGLIGFAVGSSTILSWLSPSGTTNNASQLLLILAAAGGSWEDDIFDHGHAEAINGMFAAPYAKAVSLHFAIRDAANSFAGAKTRLVSSIPNINNAGNGTVAQQLAVREGMRLFAANNGFTYVDMQDIALVEGIHPTQAGNITRARHYIRAAGATGDIGPIFQSLSRTTNTNVRATLTNLGSALVLTGNFYTRGRFFNPGGTRSIWPISATTVVNATTVDYTLSNDPGVGQALDFYAFSPQAEGVSDPSGMMLRDDRTADGLPVGRGAFANTTSIVVPAITPGGATNTPPGGINPQISTHNLTMTSPTYGAEILAGFGGVTTGGYGSNTASAGTYPLTIEGFFNLSSVPGSSFVAIASLQMGSGVILLGVTSTGGGKMFAQYFNDAASPIQLTGTTTIVAGKTYHAALVLDDNGGRIYLQNITDGTAGAREATSSTAPRKWAGTATANYRHFTGGGNAFTGSTFHVAYSFTARYTGASYTAPASPYPASEASLNALYRGADANDAVLSA